MAVAFAVSCVKNLSVLLQVETDSAYELIREGFVGEGRANGRRVLIKNGGLHLDVFSSPTDCGGDLINPPKLLSGICLDWLFSAARRAFHSGFSLATQPTRNLITKRMRHRHGAEYEDQS